MTATPVDHIAAALLRLPHMYRGADPAHETNTQKVLRALLAPSAELEQAMRDVLLQLMNVDNAVGAQLEAIGGLVGMPRQGVTDDEIYRRYVRAAISANKSDGVIEDILTIARLVVNDPAATFNNKNQGAAAFALEVAGVAISNDVALVLINLLIRAASDGVRPLLEYSEAAPGAVLRWDTQGVWDTAVWAAALDSAVLPDAGYPMSAAEMAIAIPGGTFTHGWLCDETSGDLAPVFGGVTLTASGTGLFYGDPGPRGGVDRAIGFTTGAATGKFSAASAALFDIASNTDELVVAWVGKWSALPTAFGAMFGKASAAFGNGWAINGNDGTSINFGLGPGSSWSPSATSAFFLGSWHVGIAVIDRSGTDVARFGVRDLAGTSTVLSNTASGINGNAASSASNFTIGRGDWVPGNDNFRLAALYVGKGAGVAAGLASNLPSVLASFAARISKDL